MDLVALTLALTCIAGLIVANIALWYARITGSVDMVNLAEAIEEASEAIEASELMARTKRTLEAREAHKTLCMAIAEQAAEDSAILRTRIAKLKHFALAQNAKGRPDLGMQAAVKMVEAQHRLECLLKRTKAHLHTSQLA